MVLIVGIGCGDAGKQVLITLTRQQVAVVQRVLAEIGQQGIAIMIDDNFKTAVMDRLGVACRLYRSGQRADQRLGAQLFHQSFATGVALRLTRWGAFCQSCFYFGHARLVSVPEIHVLPLSILSLAGEMPRPDVPLSFESGGACQSYSNEWNETRKTYPGFVPRALIP